MTVEFELDLEGLKKIGRIVGETLQTLLKAVRAGVTTAEIDEQAGKLLAAAGARSAPILTYGFPGQTCISINNVAAHGIPGDTIIQPGDLVNVDVSAELDGYFADTGGTVVVPPVSNQADHLCQVTQKTLWKVIHSLRAGQPMNTVGKIVEREAARGGVSVVRELTGHGVGHSLHDEPGSVYNFDYPRDQRVLTEGLVLAIEPILSLGSGRIRQERDGWTLRTMDRALVAQYEHTIVITRNKPTVITAVAA